MITYFSLKWKGEGTGRDLPVLSLGKEKAPAFCRRPFDPTR